MSLGHPSCSFLSCYSLLLWKRWPSDMLVFLCKSLLLHIKFELIVSSERYTSSYPRCIPITYFLATIFISVLLVAMFFLAMPLYCNQVVFVYHINSFCFFRHWTNSTWDNSKAKGGVFSKPDHYDITHNFSSLDQH